MGYRVAMSRTLFPDPLLGDVADQAIRMALAAATAPMMEIGGVTIPQPMEIALATITDVEMCQVGMNIKASSGTHSLTFGDVNAIVEASKDPTLKKPRLKLGHDDPRYNDNFEFDGMPAFGFADNLHLNDGGNVVRGDYVGIPVWLASVMPIAYPSRSIEGFWNWEALSGRTYDFVMTDVALLGVTWPAITALEDLPLMFGSKKPDFVKVMGV